MAKRKSRLDIRKKRSQYTRAKNTREPRKRFLIVCEGEKTEPNYFSAFRVPREVFEVRGVGYNTRSLVEEARRISHKRFFDQVWVVMDKDDFSIDQFNQALQVANNYNVKVAYSNEAFEIWYLLHFDYHDSAISRDSYQKRLTAKLGFRYEKNSSRMHQVLEAHIPTAIRNAKKLVASHGKDHSPAHDNPSTSVHLLVSELQKYAV